MSKEFSFVPSEFDDTENKINTEIDTENEEEYQYITKEIYLSKNKSEAINLINKNEDEKKSFDDMFNISEEEEKEEEKNIKDAEPQIITEKDIIVMPNKKENVKTFIIEGLKFIIEVVGLSTNDNTELTTVNSNKHIRTYNKTAVMPKINYKKAYTEKPFYMKLIPITIACICCGIFIGLAGNSYYDLHTGSNPSALSCAFLWVTETDMEYTLIPFYSDTFFKCFGIGFIILAIIILFIALDMESKKNSRVGHEHGNAHLGTRKDFKIYRKKFME